jgi:hypothetical protein
MKKNVLNIYNAKRRIRAKQYVAGKKKNILGLPKSKKAMDKSRKWLKQEREGMRAVFGSPFIGEMNKKARIQRVDNKKRTQKNKIQKKIQKSKGLYA